MWDPYICVAHPAQQRRNGTGPAASSLPLPGRERHAGDCGAPSTAAAQARRGTILKQTVRAADGRRLSTQTYGDPDGKPVFLIHVTPGSRLGPHPRSAVLHRLGVRLISFDRPGYGESDRVAGRRVADAAADVLTIADAYYGSRTWCRELGRGVRRG